jgi:hypothetical protein
LEALAAPPLVKPDLQISRIRLSQVVFVRGIHKEISPR